MARLLKDMTEPELKQYMNLLAQATESVLPEGSVFILVVFDEPALAQYISNGTRAQMIEAIQATADRLRSREDIPR